MATVCVELTEDEIIQACKHWATTRVLNEGNALSAELIITDCNRKPTGSLSSIRVWVTTERMKGTRP